jgi:hypothetical protein
MRVLQVGVFISFLLNVTVVLVGSVIFQGAILTACLKYLQGDSKVSIHWEKWFLYLQNLLCVGTITLVAHTDGSFPLMADSLLHIWCYARTCICHTFF